MGAFIAYLTRAGGVRHFFVLAPNLTIYNKLITDFTPNTLKYVFQGIAEFSTNPPEIITGDNYESGRGVRAARQQTLFGIEAAVHINIFNISKINSEVRGDKAPRIKRLSEYIGESYFEYLSKLDDLVLLVDESHRYRASAGVKAINELRPILGLELTATPQVERGAKAQPFQNVICSYPLSEGLKDGYVKEPAVATRENFDVKNYTKEGLERLKLEDGIHVHEETKTQLELYARENGVRRMKPFMLVVAEDTTHASAIKAVIEDQRSNRDDRCRAERLSHGRSPEDRALPADRVVARPRQLPDTAGLRDWDRRSEAVARRHPPVAKPPRTPSSRRGRHGAS